MVTIVKSEWHQVERQYSYEFDDDLLSEIYPEHTEEEIQEIIQQLESGDLDPESVVDEAYEQGVDIEWDHVDDEWWTDRKGGYEVTYKRG